MDVVGLISGGKDSLFNLVECQRHGHRVVVLANLYPAAGASEGEELDSHMFQMVGHHAVKHQAEAMGLPLIRRATTGVAVHRTIRYEPTTADDTSSGDAAGSRVEVDEVEDLHSLLQEVVAAYPSVRGVAVGAILSNYQRFRVEAVCRRLGLVPLAYLWQCRQRPLLHRMLDAGVDAVLVKVACMGLRVSWLGNSLAELLPQLEELADSIGMNVCGEGGEYETFVRYIPGLFKHGRVVLTETELFNRSTDPTSPDAFLAIRDSSVEPLPDSSPENPSGPPSSAGPPPRPDTTEPVPDIAVAAISATNRAPPAPTNGRVHVDGPRITIANLDASVDDRAGSVEEETHAVLRAMQSILADFGATTRDVVFVHIQLSDMGHFVSMNGVYKRYFGALPPSRACVQTNLPADEPHPIRVRLDCWASRGSWEIARSGGNERSVLHVESISSWAPVSLGPYAQANQWGGLVWLAGQIGLDPGRMQLSFPEDPARQLDVAWRHVTRVLAVHKSSVRNAMSTLLYVPEELSDPNGSVRRCWEWLAGRVSPADVHADGESTVSEGPLFDAGSVSTSPSDALTEPAGPFLSVAVPVLPKNARGELEVVGVPDRMAEDTLMHSDLQTPLDSDDGHWIGRTSTLPGVAMSLTAVLSDKEEEELHLESVSQGLVLTVAGACADGDIPLTAVHRMRVFLTRRAQEVASDAQWRDAILAKWSAGGLEPGEGVPAISVWHTSRIGTGYTDVPYPDVAAMVEAVHASAVLTDEWLMRC